MPYKIQVRHANDWITTKQEFDTREEAEKFADWNYHHDKKAYRIISND